MEVKLGNILSQPHTLNALAKKLKLSEDETRTLMRRLIDEGFVIRRERADFRARGKYELTQAGQAAFKD